MKDNPVGCFGLAVGLKVSDGSEPGLAPEGAQVIYDLRGVKLAPVVKNHGTRDAEASNDILPNELLNLGHSNRGNSLSFYPLGKVIHRDKKALALTCGFGERAEYIHAPSSKW